MWRRNGVMKPEVLIGGFPGYADRGFLGWSTVVLLRGKENFLFDTGSFGERYVLLERLRQRGVEPQDIKAIFLSHCHYDHVLNCSLFSRAEIYIHAKEYEYAMQNCEKDLVVPTEFLISLERSGRLVFLQGEGEIYPGLKVLEVPGHTPGSIALAFIFEDRRYILTGDAVKNLGELVLGEALMSLDPEASRKSISRIKERADIVIPGHDRALVVENGDIKRLEPASVTVFVATGAGSGPENFLLEVR